MTPLAYHHVDVFSRRAFHGNGLAVVLEPGALTTELMLAITRGDWTKPSRRRPSCLAA